LLYSRLLWIFLPRHTRGAWQRADLA
jgi:hypothetical protein